VARVEIWGSPFGRNDGDVGWQHRVERIGCPVRRRATVDIDAGDLTERVDTGIGPSGDGKR
jgi:hypothetical protein